MTGIVAGIALRIRAFLYAGVAFLVLNVIEQLLRFYPEQGLSRTLILPLGLGATITTVGMVVFNLKQEAILRIRIARADLAGWGRPQFGRAMPGFEHRNPIGSVRMSWCSVSWQEDVVRSSGSDDATRAKIA